MKFLEKYQEFSNHLFFFEFTDFSNFLSIIQKNLREKFIFT